MCEVIQTPTHAPRFRTDGLPIRPWNFRELWERVLTTVLGLRLAYGLWQSAPRVRGRICRTAFCGAPFPDWTLQIQARDLTLRACFAPAQWIKTGWTFVGKPDPLPSRVAAYHSAPATSYPLLFLLRPLRALLYAPAIMSHSPRGAAPAYDDAEKGTLDKVTVFPVEKKPASYPSDDKKEVFPDEKKGEVAFAAPPAPKDPFASMKATKGKKKVSKLIIVKLWYNTYRYVP